MLQGTQVQRWFFSPPDASRILLLPGELSVPASPAELFFPPPQPVFAGFEYSPPYYPRPHRFSFLLTAQADAGLQEWINALLLIDLLSGKQGRMHQ